MTKLVDECVRIGNVQERCDILDEIKWFYVDKIDPAEVYSGLTVVRMFRELCAKLDKRNGADFEAIWNTEIEELDATRLKEIKT